MHGRARAATGIAAVTLAACGGGDLETDGSGTSYPFVAPSTGTVRIYAETVVDNSNNKIGWW